MNTANFDEVNLVPALQVLVKQERGPMPAKQQVAAWIHLLEKAQPEAWQQEVLGTLCDALSVLAFANAAFCKVPAASQGFGLLPFEIQDQGGYFVALKCIRCILASAPICEECLSELEAHVERKLRGHLEQVDRLLARR